MAKTLVISLQGIGNALLALPAAEALRRAGDDVTLLALSPRLRPVLAHAPMLREIILAGDARYRGWRGRLRLLTELRRRRFDRAVFSFPSGRNSYRLARLAGIPQRVGHDYPELGRVARHLTIGVAPLRQGHDLEQNLQLVGLLAPKPDVATLWPPLVIPPELIEKGRQYLDAQKLDPCARYVGLHTGSDGLWVEKRWPEHHFARVAEAVYAKYGLPAIVFDGPAEPGSGRRVARAASSPVHALDGWGDLGDAWGLLAACDLFVSNDSGLMNLAAASGLPTVAVFGPSEAHRTRPFGPRGRAVITDRPCAPCYGLGRFAGCPHEYDPCLAEIAPERVLAAIDELIGR